MKSRTFLEWMIHERARLRRRMLNALKAEQQHWRQHSRGPDDQIIYETYEAKAAYDAVDNCYRSYKTFNPRRRTHR